MLKQHLFGPSDLPAFILESSILKGMPMDPQWPSASRSHLPLFLTILLFLNLFLPSSAQLTTPTSASPNPAPSSSAIYSSATSSPVASSSATSSTPSIRTLVISTSLSPTATGIYNGNSSAVFNVNPHAFNYYFLIVAVAAVFICTVTLYYGRMRQRKAAQQRTARINAASAERAYVMGWGSRVRTRQRNNASGSVRTDEIPEGLDERGEAPPPYKPRPSRPPSIRQGESAARSGGTEDVELGRVEGGGQGPPGYQEVTAPENENNSEVSRPPAAVTAPRDRFAAVRRLLSDTGSSHT